MRALKSVVVVHKSLLIHRGVIWVRRRTHTRIIWLESGYSAYIIKERRHLYIYRSFSRAAAGITCIHTALMLTDDAGWSILYA